MVSTADVGSVAPSLRCLNDVREAMDSMRRVDKILGERRSAKIGNLGHNMKR